MNNRIIAPNQMQLGCQHVQAPNAFPVTMVIAQAGQLISFGGLTKLEWMAGQVAAGGVQGRLGGCFDVVQMAAGILRECERVQQEAAAIGNEQEATKKTASQ